MADDSLKNKTVRGFFWSFADNFFNLGINFSFGIILARLLTPREFGLIGMITIFLVISNVFMESGFTQALLRKTDIEQKDYSTAFFTNLIIGFFLYAFLFLLSDSISNLFNEPQLAKLIKALGATIIINSLCLIQLTIAMKQLNFKLSTRITIISAVFSSTIGVVMAYNGYGVWSLVWRSITNSIFMTVLYWIWNNWKPKFIFDIESFKNLFNFGSKLLLVNLVDQIFINSYYYVVGKYVNATELGYYYRADQFKKLPSENLSIIIHRVMLPSFSMITNDNEKFIFYYRKLVKATMFMSFVLLLGMGSVARSMIVTLIGEQWLPSTIYLQLLCLSGMLFPLHSLNFSILVIKGRSDVILKLDIIKKILQIPTILFGIFINIKVMLISIAILSFICIILNAYWNNKLINYSFKDLMKDLLPSFAIASIMATIVYVIPYLITIKSQPLQLLIQVSFGAIIVIILSKIMKLEPYHDMKEIALGYIRKNNNG